MARKLKMPWGVFVENFDYCDFRRYKSLFEYGGGYLYRLCNPVNDEQRRIIAKYSNVTVLGGHAEYAPESKRYYLYIADKCFKGV